MTYETPSNGKKHLRTDQREVREYTRHAKAARKTPATLKLKAAGPVSGANDAIVIDDPMWLDHRLSWARDTHGFRERWVFLKGVVGLVWWKWPTSRQVLPGVSDTGCGGVHKRFAG